jgi:hypothetical protein
MSVVPYGFVLGDPGVVVKIIRGGACCCCVGDDVWGHGGLVLGCAIFEDFGGSPVNVIVVRPDVLLDVVALVSWLVSETECTAEGVHLSAAGAAAVVLIVVVYATVFGAQLPMRRPHCVLYVHHFVRWLVSATE